MFWLLGCLLLLPYDYRHDYFLVYSMLKLSFLSLVNILAGYLHR